MKFREIVEYFVYSNLFIAFAAVLMVFQTEFLFELRLIGYFYSFIFSAAIMSYSFHWYLLSDVENSFERQIWTHENKKLLLAFFIIGTVSTIYLFTQLLDYWFWIASIGFITFLYSAVKIPYKPFTYLQKIAIEKTLYLSIVWTYITAVLPFLVSDAAWQTNNIIFILNRFFLIYAICILFDVRDREPDQKAQIKNSITLLNMNSVHNIFIASLILFFMSLVYLHQFNFTFFQLLVISLPGVLLWISYKKSIITQSGLWYYLYLDGLMMLSAFIFYLIVFLNGLATYF
jgi:hypothetical protein